MDDQGHRVALIYSSNDDLREGVTGELAELGIARALASTREEAIHKVSEYDDTAGHLITDVLVVDGDTELIDRVHTQVPQVKVIAIVLTVKEEQEAREAGAETVLHGPSIPPSVIAEAVRRLLG